MNQAPNQPPKGAVSPQAEGSLLSDKWMWVSMGASVLSFLLNLLCSFYLTPYLIANVGDSEYSFYPLASNFVTYITIITVAINSMASRFVTVSLHRGEREKAEEYFSSTFFANIIFSAILIPISAVFIIRIDHYLVVPEEILGRVQILFTLVLASLIVGQLGTVLNIAPYYRDKIYLTSLANMLSYVVKAGSALLLFSLLPANVCYVGVMNLLAAIAIVLCNAAFTRKLMPEMRISTKKFKGSAVKDLVSAGIWNSVSQLSNVLLNGVDLLIANRYLGPAETAVISVSKTIPNQVSSIVSTIGNIFQPRFARQYAHNDTKAFVESVNSSIRLMGVVFCLPIGFLIAFGDVFFQLWVPSMDAKMLQILSILGMGVLFISASLNPIYGVFTVTNKIKTNSLVVLGTGVLNVLIVISALHFVEDMAARIIIIVGTSTIIGIVRNLCFTVVYTAKCMNVKWHSFYPPMLLNVLLLAVSVGVFYVVRLLLPSGSWLRLIICGVVGVAVGGLPLWFLALKKSERKSAIHAVKEKLRRKK